MDVQLPDGNGVDVCRNIRWAMPEVSCLMLTSYGDDKALFNAIVGAVRDEPVGRMILRNIRWAGLPARYIR